MLVGYLFKRGLKFKFINVLVKVLNIVKRKFKTSEISVLFWERLNSLRPVLRLMRKSLSGKIYRIPAALKVNKSFTIAVHWFMVAVRLRKERTFFLKLQGEVKDLLAKTSSAFALKKEHYKIIKENKQHMYLGWHSRRKSGPFLKKKPILNYHKGN